MSAAAAYLIVDVGSIQTRVTLIDAVEGVTRLIGHVCVPSSHVPPAQHLLYAIVEAASTLSDTTGRLLVQGGRLLMPQRDNLDGVDRIIVTSSAGGLLRVTVVALARALSADAVLTALDSGPYILSHLVCLDRPFEDSGSADWLARQAEVLVNDEADLIVLAGGLDDGAADGVIRLAQLIALTNSAPVVQRSRPVIFAGNVAARDAVHAILSGRMPLFITENVQPTLEHQHLGPLNRLLAEQYAQARLATLPGAAVLQQAGWPTLRTTEAVQQFTARFLAQHLQRNVLVVDCGAAAVRASLASPEQQVDLVLSEYGLGRSVTGLLAAVGAASITRWLPFALDEHELTDWLLNRRLRPMSQSFHPRDVLIDLALAREALRCAGTSLERRVSPMQYDWLIAAGGLFAALRDPGLVLLTLLDGLQPNDSPNALCEVHLDRLNLLATVGALAAHDAVAAVDLYEHDLLANVPLATLVLPQGQGKPGSRALEVELIPVDGVPQRRTVHFGELVCLALPPGTAAQLRVTPAAAVRLGRAAAGEPLESDPAEIRGSLLGLVIDMRGRPLELPVEAPERYRRILSWYEALGVTLTAEQFVHQPPSAPAAETPADGVDELPPELLDTVESLRRHVTRRRRIQEL